MKRLLQMEIAAGPFERRLRIAIPFDRENVSAHLADGFLTVTPAAPQPAAAAGEARDVRRA